MACTILADGDPISGWDIAEEMYDEAEEFVKALTDQGIKNLPGGRGQDAKIVQFPGT